MKRLVAATALTLAAFGFASQASASLVTVTYQGVVNATQSEPSGFLEPTADFDTADLFGGGNLEGYDLTFAVQYNTSLGSPSSSDDPGYYDEIDGGSGFFNTSPITNATLTISVPTISGISNNYSYSFTPDYYGVVETDAYDGFVQELGNSSLGDGFIAYLNTPDAPSNLETSFSSEGPDIIGSGYLLTADQSNGQSDNIPFDTYSVTVSATPEPSTWALMIAGLGVAGFALRRRTALKPASVQTA